MTMQDKIIHELCDRTRDAGLDPVVHRDFANTGHIYVQQAFATLLDAEYDFQRESFTLAYRGDLADAYMSGGTWKPVLEGVGLHGALSCRGKYADPGEVQRLLDMFTSMLPPGATGAGRPMTPARAWQEIRAAIPDAAADSKVQDALAVLAVLAQAGTRTPQADGAPGSLGGTTGSETTETGA